MNPYFRDVRHCLSIFAAMLFLSFGSSFINVAAADPIIAKQLSNKCLDIYGGSRSNGANAIQWNCHGGGNQDYTFVEVSGAYQIKASHSGRCLSVQNGSTRNGAYIVQQDCSSDGARLWTLSDEGTGHFIKNVNSGKCMRVKSGSTQNGARIVQSNCSARADRLWDTSFFEASDTSQWDGPIAMPLVAVAAANLPDGRILTWSAYSKTTFGGEHGRTYTAIFDPETGTSTEGLITNTGHDMFCPGIAMLPDGKVMVTGGSNSGATSIYSPISDQWSIAPRMNIPRGYHAMTPLSDGSVFTLGGSWSGGVGSKGAEIWNPDGTWNLLAGIPVEPFLTTDQQGVYRADNHMWLFEAPNGLIFHAGPSSTMHWINRSEAGSYQVAGQRADDGHAMNGNAVMYDIGKILTIGGAPDYQNSDATKRAYVIDITTTGTEVSVERVGDMEFARAYHNSVVLPNGEVVVVGGQSYPVPFSDETSIYEAEIWNPQTGQFTTLAQMEIPRNYHSAALLQKDGRVFVGGGGLCGGCSTNHLDAEILTPPYLLNNDGSVIEDRPIITSAPSATTTGESISVTLESAGNDSFVLIRTAAATHAVNNDERRIPVVANYEGNNSYTVSVPSSNSVVIPGNYFLFALNDSGVPSVAELINIQPADPIDPVDPVESVITRIESRQHSGRCVDIEGGSRAVGASAIQWSCHNYQNQSFTISRINNLYEIKVNHSNKCLGVKDASIQSTAKIVQQDCTYEPHQLWDIQGSGDNHTLRVSHTGMCLNIEYGSRNNLAKMIQYPCQGGSNEKWWLGADFN